MYHKTIRIHQLLIVFAVLCLTACSSTSSAPPATITIAEQSGSIPMIWGAMARPAPLPPLKNASLLVPVQIDGIDSKRLHMQFDLGHPSTIVYANKWADIAKRLSQPPAIDKISALTFRVGTLTATARDIGVLARAGSGIDWSQDSIEVIGTIGADFIDGRIVLLDFKNNLITLASTRNQISSLPTTGIAFQPFTFQGRRILLPAKFDGNDLKIMYDSGSSAFAWLTNESTFTRLAQKGATPISYPIRSWDKTLTAHSVATDAMVTIGDVTFSIGELSRIEGMGILQETAVSVLGIGGMVGNKLFLNRTVVIDVGKREFAILN